MNEDFVNVYIEMMNKKIEELTRSEIILQTRLAIAEKVLASFKEENDSLKEEIEKIQGSLNKKPVKTKENDF
jgi:uncharacterized protein YktB (UPF0637 family)